MRHHLLSAGADMSDTTHKWRFFCAGDFDQPLISTAADLAALASLDQKLWASLACPTSQLNISSKFLQMLDANGDDRIRAPELIAAVNWTLARLNNPDCLFEQRQLAVNDFKDCADNHNLIRAAQRLLQLLGRQPQDSLDASDTADTKVIFPANAANGDGLVPPQLTTDPLLKQQIAHIINCLGAVTDRSGEDAVDENNTLEFYAQVSAVQSWHSAADEQAKQPFGAATATVIPLLARLQDKINDFFTRIELVAYDSRAATIMAADEAQLHQLASGDLSHTESLQHLPLANLQQQDGISFTSGINPAWRADMQLLYETAIKPQWGEVERLELQQWQQLLSQARVYFDWQASKPDSQVGRTLPLDTILAIDAPAMQQQLLALIASDLEVAEAAQGWVDLDKLLNMQQYLVVLLKNFVSFENFYGQQEKAIFQAGTLYIDGKSCDLVVEVKDVDAHSKIAVQSDSYLIYCHCLRRGQPVGGREECKIVALISNGSDHELMVGRNGLFYDRDGNDWDATVVKVIDNAISVRDAFWSPYRRVANMVSTQIQKLASSQDEQLLAIVSDSIEQGKPQAPFDIAKFAGIFAAIGLAIGAIGTAFAAAFSGLMTMHWWQWPLVVIAIAALISGPSMLLAWFKLRRRSLGPILDANGWAVNARARISISFGSNLTQIASLPQGSGRSLKDPHARKSRARWWLFLLLITAAAAAWYYFHHFN